MRLGESFAFGVQPSVAVVANFGTTGDKMEFYPYQPARIIRMGYIWTSATVTAPQLLVLSLEKRVTAGSDTGRVVLFTMLGVTGEVQGSASYKNAPTPMYLDADEELVLEVTTAATAGSAAAFVELQLLGFSTGTVAGLGGFVRKTA